MDGIGAGGTLQSFNGIMLLRLPEPRPNVNNPLKPAPAVSENNITRTDSVGKLLLLLDNTPHHNQESTAQKKQQQEPEEPPQRQPA